MGEGLAQQLADQTAETDTLRAAYQRLQQKLTETQARVDLMVAQMRRSRAVEKAGTAQAMLQSGATQGRLSRLSGKAEDAESKSAASRAMLAIASAESLDERFETMERNDKIEELLLELKQRQPRLT